MIASRLFKNSVKLLRWCNTPPDRLTALMRNAGSTGDLDMVEQAYQAIKSGRNRPYELVEALDYVRANPEAEANLPFNLKLMLLQKASASLADIQNDAYSLDNFQVMSKLLYYLYKTDNWKDGKVLNYLHTVMDPYIKHLLPKDSSQPDQRENIHYVYLKAKLSNIGRLALTINDCHELTVLMNILPVVWPNIDKIDLDCQKIREKSSPEELQQARLAVLHFLKTASRIKAAPGSENEALWRAVKLVPGSFFKPMSSLNLETILRLLSVPTKYSPLKTDQLQDLRKSVEQEDFAEWHTSELIALLTGMRQGWEDEDFARSLSKNATTKPDQKKSLYVQATEDAARAELRKKRQDSVWKVVELRMKEDFEDSWMVSSEEFSELVDNLHYWLGVKFREVYGFKPKTLLSPTGNPQLPLRTASKTSYQDNERYQVAKSLLDSLSQALRRLIAMNRLTFDTTVKLLTVIDTVPGTDVKMANQLQFAIAHSLKVKDFDTARLDTLHRHFEGKKRGSRSLRIMMAHTLAGKDIGDVYRRFVDVKKAKIKVDGYKTASKDDVHNTAEPKSSDPN